jgi:tRNA(Ile)-lysidine synthase
MKLDQFLDTTLRLCRLVREEPVLVGVSGGADSLCLLDSLAGLQFRVVAAHFDHGLRSDSARDAEKVRLAAEKLGVPFVLGSADVSGYAREQRLSLEAAARALRYRFLFDQARRITAQAVAVGHTADDQVETVLMHLLRGAGLNGLQGMTSSSLHADWDAAIPLVRPLLGFWRAETLAYCAERGLQPVFDPTNLDTAFFRNKLRNELIPLLEAVQPEIRQTLWRTAQALSGDAEIVRAAVEAAWSGCRAEQVGEAVILRRPEFQALSPGLQRGLLRKAVAGLQNGAGDAPRDVDYEAIERAARFARSPGDGQVDLALGLRLVAEGERLLVTRSALPWDARWPRLETAELHLAFPGETALSSGWQMAAEWVEQAGFPVFPTADASPWEAWLDASSLPGEVCLRRAQPGDRFQPLGMEGHSLKLSDFWINEKLPRRARAAWPLVAAGKQILWVPGFRLAHPYRVQKNTRKALHLRLFRVEDEKED